MSVDDAAAATTPDTPAVPPHFQTFLAFDYGQKRTGVATGNRLLGAATPRATPRLLGAMYDLNEAVVRRRRAAGMAWNWNVGLAAPLPPAR